MGKSMKQCLTCFYEQEAKRLCVKWSENREHEKGNSEFDTLEDPMLTVKIEVIRGGFFCSLAYAETCKRYPGQAEASRLFSS